MVSQRFGDDSKEICRRMGGTEKTAERKEKEKEGRVGHRDLRGTCQASLSKQTRTQAKIRPRYDFFPQTWMPVI